jgi:hypothetical protein
MSTDAHDRHASLAFTAERFFTVVAELHRILWAVFFPLLFRLFLN